MPRPGPRRQYVSVEEDRAATPPEPKRRGALVRDRDGDVWKRGNTRWTCQAPVDGVRVRSVGRLPWHTLVSWYGPVTELD